MVRRPTFAIVACAALVHAENGRHDCSSYMSSLQEGVGAGELGFDAIFACLEDLRSVASAAKPWVPMGCCLTSSSLL